MSVASCLTHGEGVLFRASASLIMRCSPTLLPLMDFWMSRLGLASKLPVDDEAASPTSPVHSEVGYCSGFLSFHNKGPVMLWITQRTLLSCYLNEMMTSLSE